MNVRKKLLGILTILLLCILVTTPVNAATKINKSKATLIKGQTLQLKITGTRSKVKWSSSKKSVATVTSVGKVIAKNNGTATITAKVGNKKHICKVTVKTPKLSVTKVNLYIGDYKRLNVSGGVGTVKWTTSNKRVARVSPDGLIDAIGCGTCKIIATVGKMKLTCKVNVTVEDPECFPSKNFKFGDITIKSFDAKFISYKVYRDYSKTVNNICYFFPYKYRIKIVGKGPKSSLVSIRFCFLTNGRVPDMPGNNCVSIKTDANGNFTIDKNLKFSTYGEMLYIASIYAYQN